VAGAQSKEHIQSGSRVPTRLDLDALTRLFSSEEATTSAYKTDKNRLLRYPITRDGYVCDAAAAPERRVPGEVDRFVRAPGLARTGDGECAAARWARGGGDRPPMPRELAIAIAGVGNPLKR